ncbi:MAG: type II toxin-antitoxin system prevent-host-death family antitoxin [Chloroflexi bacterium]|nr:type II toxin-antitoxin system prevent-host-death family antitoxin [Chloroflexota bacterium]
MEVGVRELKKHLSAYLDRAARGEVIQVTDRGRPKATLGPVPIAARIEQGIGEGWITRGSGAPPFGHRRFTPVRPLGEVLDEDGGK